MASDDEMRAAWNASAERMREMAAREVDCGCDCRNEVVKRLPDVRTAYQFCPVAGMQCCAIAAYDVSRLCIPTMPADVIADLSANRLHDAAQSADIQGRPGA